MKKLLTVITLGVVAVSLVACGGGETKEASGNTGATTGAMAATTTAQAPKADGQLGNYVVKIKSSEQFKTSYEGKQALKVIVDFTNNSDEAVAFDLATMAKAFQDGIELDQAFDVAKLGDNQSKQIKKGATIEVAIAFELSNQESPVEVEITEFMSFNDDKVTQTIELK